ncbi:hypothetical protein VTK73DRAFT_7654 [Phialemonium thermophilum]|uniref:TATA element modulatory factor 1 TATA binding domain-containing protein n=1 Tax=Phialemonium thermophilum TaxID=223376 RepID=A0ABR3Y6F6_9PEZI
MAAPTKRSGWGSLLSQAVAGVEARLDTILAENDDAPRDASKPSPTPSPAPSSPHKSSPGLSRTSSTNRGNDRLQERLARAMAAKNAGQRSGSPSVKPSTSSQASPRQSTEIPSRTSVESSSGSSQPVPETSPPRDSVDATRRSGGLGPQSGQATPDLPTWKDGRSDAEEEVNREQISAKTPPAITVTGDGSYGSVALFGLSESAQSDTANHGNGEARLIEELQRALEHARIQFQEEVHSYVERIDALEAKLQYMAREATDSARKAAAAAPAGSLEKKLAEKDQQIAQLMEEGKNLASTEQKHRAIIKKLRTKIAEDEKETNNLKLSQDKISKELDSLRKKVATSEELERAHEDLRRRFDQLQKELNTLRPELNSKDATISDLKTRLQKATKGLEEANNKANGQAREQDSRRIAELEELVAALKVEKDLAGDRAKIQAADLREKAERAAERAQALELELRAEIRTLEGKLEAMRMRAEEVSAGTTGDSQAKLLRQIETLQTQYSIASENWQGIESTLQARIVSLEKEREEALQRESEMRKKAREVALRAKKAEEELEEARTKLPSFQDDVKSYQTQIDSLRKRAEEAETALAETRAEVEKHKTMLKAEKEEKQKHERAEQERRGWLEDLPPAPFRSNSRPESPLLTTSQRTFSSDFLGLESLPPKFRKASAPSSNGGAIMVDRSVGHRPYDPPQSRPSIPASLSSASPGVFSSTVEALPTPSTNPVDRDDMFENVESSSSPRQVLQDMVSVSTVAAGPSVQLVERMSAAIRRLESEKVAAREELARISKQRDEARAEIVALMREVEASKVARERVVALEAEIAEVTARYETTLELLGEKSELVEELRADVEDVKAMYRDLVERTVK